MSHFVSHQKYFVWSPSFGPKPVIGGVKSICSNLDFLNFSFFPGLSLGIYQVLILGGKFWQVPSLGLNGLKHFIEFNYKKKVLFQTLLISKIIKK